MLGSFRFAAVASGYEGFEISHDVVDLSSLKLEPRHDWMDPVGQGPLQVGNRILEMQRAERRSGWERTLADLIDCMASRAMHADKSQAASFCWNSRIEVFCRGLCQSDIDCR
jgi:hypothetical protein